MSDSDQKLKDEFLKYVEDQKEEIDFDTDEGKDIVYDICLRHKALPVGKRNWNELAGLLALGEDRGGEWLRCWMKQRQRENGALPRNPRIAIPSDLSDNPDDHTDMTKEEMAQQRQDLYIERQKTRDVYNAYRRSLRSETRVQEFKELIQESAQKAKTLPNVNCDFDEKNSKNEAILMISDFHIGDKIDNFYNKYNAEIAIRRFSHVIGETIEKCKRNHVEKLNVVNLGDLVAGIIHISSRLEQEENVSDQVLIASKMLSEGLNELQKAAPIVTYRSCLDNHGRMSPDIHQNIEEENFGKIIDFYLEARLEGSKIQIIHDNLSDDIGRIVLDNNKKVLFVHGNRDYPDSAFKNMVGATQEYIDYILMAHRHSPAYHEDNGCRIITNGCLCGSTLYADSKRFYGKASQTLLVFEGNDLITNIIECDLK
jgi:predicted phosphodiesterase